MTELWTAGVRAFRAQGFVAGSYYLIKGAQFSPLMKPVSWGYPRGFVEAYLAHDYSRLDAAARRCVASGKVLTWTEAWQIEPNTREEEAFRARVAGEMDADGLAVPCFGPRQRNGYVSLMAREPGRTYAPGERRWLQSLAQTGHLRLCELLFGQAPEIALSPREREILHWVALGKSNTVIAQLVNCSANTVDTHLRRIYVKMQVTDRTTAAIKAIGLGLIT